MIAQAVQHAQQQVDIVEMQTGRRLVQYVQRAPGIALREFERQFHALRFAAGEGRRALTERDVAEAHVEQRVQLACDRRHRSKKFGGLLDRHAEHFGDVLAFVLNVERLAVVALAMAHLARHVDVREKVHLDLDDAVALAGFAAPAFYVERKTAGTVTAFARHRHASEQFADRREEPGVGRGIRARRASDRALIDVDDLVEMIESLDCVVRGRLRGAAVEVTRGCGVERVVDQRRFAGAGYARHADEQADRNIDLYVFQIVAVRAFDRQQSLGIGFVPQARNFDAPLAGQILAGQRLGRVADIVGRALRDHAAAVLAGTETDVDDVIGVLDRILIVLDDDDGVADVAQALECFEQSRVVALMQADRRLVEHVHDAGQSRADLACETNALRFAAGQRIRRAVEREVIEPDVVQKLDAVDDFPDDAVGDRAFCRRQVGRAKKFLGLLERQRAQFVDRAARDVHVARFAPQPRAVAIRADLVVQIFGEFFAHDDRVGFAITPLEIRQNPFERVFAVRFLDALADVNETDFFAVRAVEHGILDRGGQFFERRIEVELIMRRETLQHLKIKLVALVPTADRAGGERQVRIRDDAPRIEEADLPEPVAARARAHRIVERKEARFEFGQRVAADRAREARGKKMLFAAVHLDGERAAVRVAQRRLERFGEPLLEFRPHFDAVDDDFDRVLDVLFELRQLVDFVHVAVDAHAHEPLRPQLFEEIDLLAFAANDERRQDHEARVGGQFEHVIDHLRDALRFEHDVVVGTVRVADARVEQAQVIVNFGHRADGRARIVARRFLLDGNRRRQPFDEVDVGLFHHLQKLARVGRQRFDVTALAFRVKRIEGERRLARARQSGDHDELIARQVEIDVLQIVRARAANADQPGVLRGRGRLARLQLHDCRSMRRRRHRSCLFARVNLLIYRTSRAVIQQCLRRIA